MCLLLSICLHISVSLQLIYHIFLTTHIPNPTQTSSGSLLTPQTLCMHEASSVRGKMYLHVCAHSCTHIITVALLCHHCKSLYIPRNKKTLRNTGRRARWRKNLWTTCDRDGLLCGLSAKSRAEGPDHRMYSHCFVFVVLSNKQQHSLSVSVPSGPGCVLR